MNMLFAVSFFAYIIGLTLIGLYLSKKQKTASDFMVGSRSVNYWVTAIATHATDMSAWLFMAFPALVYTHGLVACWTAAGLLVGMFLSWQFVAKKLRQATELYKTHTISSYFEERFSDTSGSLRISSSLISLFFFSLYISAGIVALGRALEAAFGFSYHTGITLGTFTVAAYTVLGGFIAIAWNDFLQGMFVLIVVTVFPLYALSTVGWFPGIFKAAAEQHISLSLIPDFSLKTLASIIIPGFGWGLGYFGQPHILVNFMGIDNPNEIRKAKYVGLCWQFFTLGAATLIGLIGIAYFKTPLAQTELVFIDMIKGLFNPLLAGVAFCAILAAAISTMDSQILVSASTLTLDVYKKIFNKTANSVHLLTISRIASVAIVLISFLFAYNNDESIFNLVLYAWCGLGSTFGPVLLFSLYSNKITKQGALAGILIGGFVAGSWKYLGLPLQNYGIIPGFFFSTCAILIVSRFFSKK